MANYLTQIVQRKAEEVINAEKKCPLAELKEYPFYLREPLSLAKYFNETDEVGIICEFKRASPSKGVINKEAKIDDVVLGYQQAGACAVSVLTDTIGFMGSLGDLAKARKVLNIPLLRKDFIISEYQIFEAKSHGADIILLIAACLGKSRVEELSLLAHDLGLEVLLEVHGVEELGCLGTHIDFLGVNNRDLKTFKVTLDISRKIAKKHGIIIPMISESGISRVEEIRELESLGYSGFLIGENFMKSQNPGRSCAEFLAEVYAS